jgi:hypothetical protein
MSLTKNESLAKTNESLKKTNESLTKTRMTTNEYIKNTASHLAPIPVRKPGTKRTGLVPFEKLQTSTMTVMVYANMDFVIDEVFRNIPITPVSVPLTKKQKNVDKKRIVAPNDSVISVQSETRIRGVDLRKRKKHWCTVCQPRKITDEKESKLLTITEKLARESGTDIDHVVYYCSRCQKDYKPVEIKKINYFLNQLTIVLSIGKQPLLNVMLFKDNFKIAGCKDVDDAADAILTLWDVFFSKHPTAWKLKEGHTEPGVIFETVMRNVDFKLGFPIERSSLNSLMNSDEFANNVFMSQYESTGHTNVNIKMFSRIPENFRYDCLRIPLNGDEPYFTKVKANIFKSKKKREKDAKKEKYITFIVFSSSEIILSGRYNQNMKEMYEFFVKTVFEHRKVIEEKLDAPNEKDLIKLRGQLKKQLW